jgi:3-deoxy-D-manno-octulosonic-acid transferase
VGRVARTGYAIAGQVARALAVVAPPGRSKLVRTFRARRGIRARYEAWSRSGRDTGRPLLWMHAPSVGEGLQARPIVELIRARRADIQLAYTFFSPSAEAFASRLGVDFADYLPFDTGGDARAALAALTPTALVFSKLDVWPTLAHEASRLGVPLGLISATLAKTSARRGALAGSVLREAYARLTRVGAIDERDAERLVSLGVPRDRVSVTGDTRYDQVWARTHHPDAKAKALVAALADRQRPTLVAGSTWPADERVLLPAWQAVRAAVPGARLIIAPHEPVPAHLAPIERWAQDARLAVLPLDAEGVRHADVVLVDRVGVLGDLYALADVAYVGGGFHAAGLHSVLEPAAFGAPVLFGPQHDKSRDAELLLDRGGAVMADDAPALQRAAHHWLTDASARRSAGDAARQLVHDGLGAAERSLALVLELMR